MKSKGSQKITLDASKLVGFTKANGDHKNQTKAQPKVGVKPRVGQKVPKSA